MARVQGGIVRSMANKGGLNVFVWVRRMFFCAPDCLLGAKVNCDSIPPQKLEDTRSIHSLRLGLSVPVIRGILPHEALADSPSYCSSLAFTPVSSIGSTSGSS